MKFYALGTVANLYFAKQTHFDEHPNERNFQNNKGLRENDGLANMAKTNPNKPIFRHNRNTKTGQAKFYLCYCGWFAARDVR